MHHTHAPSENENFPSAKPPARTSFLSFFPSHFRSSFRHFCHVLCDFYFSFQVPKPPVFTAFSLLQGILLLILFFLRQKNLHLNIHITQTLGRRDFFGCFLVHICSFYSPYSSHFAFLCTSSKIFRAKMEPKKSLWLTH